MTLAACRRDGGTAPRSPAEAAPGWALVTANSLPLVSDVREAWRWFSGERDIPGFPAVTYPKSERIPR